MVDISNIQGANSYGANLQSASIQSASIQSASIQSACDAILREGRLTELPVVSPDAPLGVFDGDDRDILVPDDLAFINVVRCERSVLIQGSIRGSLEHPVRIEAKGSIVVIGSVHHAQLSARRVLIGGRACHSQVTAAQQATIGGALETGRVIAGDYQDDRRRIESCRLTMEQVHVQAESVARRVTTEEKRLDKACRVLRIPLNFGVGRIVQHEDGRLRIDLSSFYGALEGRTDEQLELALAEFFAKGIIGVITRSNRKYLVNYPAREKVFMQLVKSLRELFQAVFERDRLQRRVEWLTSRLDHLVESLSTRHCPVDVGGTIAGLSTLEFIVPRVVLKPKDGGFDFFHKTARLEIHRDGAAVELVSCGTDGGRMSTMVTAAEMEGLRFAIDGDHILWESTREPVGA